MRSENKKMKEFLKRHRIDAVPKYIGEGSLRGSWRLYKKGVRWYGNRKLQKALIEIGFKNLWGKELDEFTGNGGMFSIFVTHPRTKDFLDLI